MPDRMPEDMPDRMPEDTPEHMPEDMPDRMPDRMPEDMSDRMPEDLSVRKCINVMVGITRSKVVYYISIFIYIYTYTFHNPWYIHQTSISVFLLLNLPAAEATLVIEASGFRPSRRGFLVLEVFVNGKDQQKNGD